MVIADMIAVVAEILALTMTEAEIVKFSVSFLVSNGNDV